MQDKNKTMKIVAIVMVVVIVVLGAVVAFLLFSKYQQETSTVTVKVSVQAPDYDAQTGSGVPVSIDGKDSNGSSVSEKILIDGSTAGVELHNGSYELKVAGSPVNATGGIYEVPAKTYSIKIDGNDVVIDGEKLPVEKTDGKIVEFSGIELFSIEPASVADAQIEAVRTWMQDFGLSQERIDSLVSLIKQSRAEAVRRNEAAALEAWRTKVSGQFIGSGMNVSSTSDVDVYFNGDKVTVTGKLRRWASGSLGARLEGSEWHFILTDSTQYSYVADGDFPVSKEYFQNNFLPDNFPAIRMIVEDGYVKEIVASP